MADQVDDPLLDEQDDVLLEDAPPASNGNGNAEVVPEWLTGEAKRKSRNEIEEIAGFIEEMLNKKWPNFRVVATATDDKTSFTKRLADDKAVMSYEVHLYAVANAPDSWSATHAPSEIKRKLPAAARRVTIGDTQLDRRSVAIARAEHDALEAGDDGASTG